VGSRPWRLSQRLILRFQLRGDCFNPYNDF
jgi:hypothetical protein